MYKRQGIDCGSCGAPNCRAFAEDVVTCGVDKSQCILMHHKELMALLEKQEADNDDGK